MLLLTVIVVVLVLAVVAWRSDRVRVGPCCSAPWPPDDLTEAVVHERVGGPAGRP